MSAIYDRLLAMLDEHAGDDGITTIRLATLMTEETREVHETLKMAVQLGEVEALRGAPTRYRLKQKPAAAKDPGTARAPALIVPPATPAPAEPAPEPKPEPAPPAPAPEPAVSSPTDTDPDLKAVVDAIVGEPGILPPGIQAQTGLEPQMMGRALGQASRLRLAHREGKAWFPGPGAESSAPARQPARKAVAPPRTTPVRSNAPAVLETLGRLRAGGVAEDVAVSALEPLLGPADTDVLLDRIRRAPLPTLLKWAASLPA